MDLLIAIPLIIIAFLLVVFGVAYLVAVLFISLYDPDDDFDEWS